MHDLAVPKNASLVILVNCTNIKVQGINITNIVELVSCQRCIIKNCIIQNNTIERVLYPAIYLKNSTHNYVEGNLIFANGVGVALGSFGSFTTGSKWNEIYNNSIIGNDYALFIIRSCNNKIFHNDFIDNVRQAFLYPGNVTNMWDDGYPSGGNYWSDYNGTDTYSGPYQNITGSDGIGDTPYIINENNIDRYPLMKPWRSLNLKIINLTLTDQNGNQKTTFLKGEIAQFNFTIRNIGSLDLTNGLISVMILDPLNTPIFLCYIFESISQGITKEFIIGYRVPLTAPAGTYTVKVMIFTDWPSEGGTGLDIKTSTFEVS